MSDLDIRNVKTEEEVGGQYPFWNPHYHGRKTSKRQGAPGDKLVGVILAFREAQNSEIFERFVDVDVSPKGAMATLRGKAMADKPSAVTWPLNKTYSGKYAPLENRIGCVLTVEYRGELPKSKGRDEAAADYKVTVSKKPVTEMEEL